MLTLLRFTLLLSLAVFTATAGQLDDLQANFQTRCDFAEAERDLQIKKLDDSYLAALNRQLEKVKPTGKLDLVLPLVDEIEAVKSAKQPLAELPKSASSELKDMRAKYIEARAKILKFHAQAVASLADKMTAALKTQESELTKAGKIKEALAAKQLRESLEKDEKLLDARDFMQVHSDPIAPKTWQSLLGESMKILESGPYDITLMSEIKQDTKYFQPFIEILKGQDEKPEKILITMSPAKIEYRFNHVITQARGKIILGNSQGTIRFRIHNGKNEVFDQLLQGERLVVPYEVTFEATKLLRIEVDPVENPNHDWAALLNPEVR